MDYVKHYNMLIERAKCRKELNATKTTHRHHIIPRCCGGSDDESNMVTLYLREHYIAHLLLAKIYKGTVYENSILYALKCFRTFSKNGLIVNSRLFETLLTSLYRHISETLMGHEVTKETRRKLSLANIGNKNPMFGKHHSAAARKKFSERCGEKGAFYGRIWICNDATKETKTIFKNDEIPNGWRRGRIMKPNLCQA